MSLDAVSIPSSSGQAFGQRTETRHVRKVEVSIPSSSGQAFGRVRYLGRQTVQVSIPSSSGQAFGHERREDFSWIRRLNPFFVRAGVRTDRCRERTHYQRVAWRHVQPHGVPQSQPPSPALRLLGCQRALVTTRSGCRWRAGFYHRPPAPRRSTLGTLGCRRSAGR